MAKDNNQKEQPKPQSDKIEEAIHEEAIHYDRQSSQDSKETVERVRKGTAGDGTGSTGPRKKE